MRRLLLSLIPILLVAILLPSTRSHARVADQQADPLTLEVRVGFDGNAQGDTYNPITITASNTGEGVSGELRVVVEGFTSGKTVYARPIDLPNGSRKQITLYPGDLSTFDTQVQVELVRGGRVLATSAPERIQFVPATTLLVGLLAGSPQGLTDIGVVRPSSGQTRVATLTVDDLPAVGRGWSALDVLIISDVDTGQMSSDQQAALAHWVASGGRLMLIGGPAYQRTLAGVGSLAPINVNDTANVSLLPLMTATGLEIDPQLDTDALVAVGALSEDAVVMVESDGIPLIASRDVGFGRVDFLAADPALEPLRSWDEMQQVWRLILQSGHTRPGWAYGFSGNQWEMARQAAAAVPGVRLPSVFQLCGFLALYVVLIGPVNYLVLWRLKRRELAWVTIPALVLLFSAIAYITGFQLRGSEVIIHRLTVMQSWADSDVARVDTLVGIWSPRRARYDIQLEPGYLARPMPSDSLGGGISATGDTVIENSESVVLRRVQVDVGSVQPFVVEGFEAEAPRIEGDLTIETADRGLRVTGEIINYSAVDLDDVTLMIAGVSHKLPDLEAGEVITINETVGGGRSTPGGGGGFDPFPPTDPYGSGYYGYYYDPLVMEIAHTEDCYAFAEKQRECDLVISVLNGNWRGSGIYLFGWSKDNPTDMQVLNANARTVDTTLHIIQLDAAAVETSRTTSDVPPGLMTWEIIANPTGAYITSPYDFYIPYDSNVAFRFEPVSVIEVPQVNRIRLAIESYYEYDTGSNEPRIELRNFETGRWEQVNIDWGENIIEDAAKYVDALGGVEIKLSITYNDDGSISLLEVSLLED